MVPTSPVRGSQAAPLAKPSPPLAHPSPKKQGGLSFGEPLLIRGATYNPNHYAKPPVVSTSPKPRQMQRSLSATSNHFFKWPNVVKCEDGYLKTLLVLGGALLFVCGLVSLAILFAAGEEEIVDVPSYPLHSRDGPTLSRLHADGRWIKDEDGRVVVLRGVNQVNKRPPFDAESIGFDDRHGRFLAENGFNVVRLGVLWTAIEHVRGEYDMNYLKSLHRTVKMLCSHGIYTLLDLHQDAFSTKHGGCGFPEWAALSTKDTSDAGFPRNIFGGNLTHISLAVAEDFSFFFENKEGVRDSFMKMLSTVSREFGGDSCVAGLEVMNEPFPGVDWPKCGKPDPSIPVFKYNFHDGCKEFGRDTLTPFYQEAVEAVRRESLNMIVFYDQDGIGGIGGDMHIGHVKDVAFERNLGFSFHNYLEQNYERVFETTHEHCSKNMVAPFMTEFGANPDPMHWDECLADADAHIMPWIYWAYSNNPTYKFSDTGGRLPPDPRLQGVVFNTTFTPAGDNLKLAVVEALTRPYPQVVSGEPLKVQFDPKTKVFVAEYLPDRERGVSVIAVPARVYPADVAMDVAVEGGQHVPCEESKAGAGAYICIENDASLDLVKVTVSVSSKFRGTENATR